MPEFTLGEISAALSRLLHVPQENGAINRLAGRLEQSVNASSAFREEGLQGSGFASLVMTNLPPEVADLMNPAKLQELQRQHAENANRYGAAFAANAAAIGLQGRMAQAAAMREMGESPGARSVGIASSTRFDGLSSPELTGDWSSPAGIAFMRESVIKAGMSWLANDKEFLKLGPGAVQALADVHLGQESYQNFKKVGLNAKTIVAGARYAKRHGVDYNEASRAIKNTNDGLSEEDKELHRWAVQRLFNAKPGEEKAASKDYDRTMEKLEKRSPKLRQRCQHERKVLKQLHKDEKQAKVNASKSQSHLVSAQENHTEVRAQEKVVEHQADQSRGRLAALLKKRQATASTPTSTHG